MGGKSIEITEVAADDIVALGRPLSDKVFEKIEALGQDPQLGRRLHAPLADYRKLRFSRVRVVYREYPEKIVVIAVGARRDKEVYDLALTRVTGG